MNAVNPANYAKVKAQELQKKAISCRQGKSGSQVSYLIRQDLPGRHSLGSG
ncbi:hypothetical protein PP175_12925 [Aneurinibacillus sp. Ricciae_BoGa-3]|uniref:hypothetical protein n=1 Tax=Aneurinibacillus sp. Ricciae_BoGa-3 TaxID=3022697 RepID=UPI00234257A6|nr:hypothetical protein [Aneurinibacillus sp. Ricciae_BoGa-3]WCK52364.1 hypothetical protein PP175_12925 [Aneurinibacillus sp. Ricciae_BoGa-3]